MTNAFNMALTFVAPLSFLFLAITFSAPSAQAKASPTATCPAIVIADR